MKRKRMKPDVYTSRTIFCICVLCVCESMSNTPTYSCDRWFVFLLIFYAIFYSGSRATLFFYVLFGYIFFPFFLYFFFFYSCVCCAHIRIKACQTVDRFTLLKRSSRMNQASGDISFLFDYSIIICYKDIVRFGCKSNEIHSTGLAQW